MEASGPGIAAELCSAAGAGPVLGERASGVGARLLLGNGTDPAKVALGNGVGPREGLASDAGARMLAVDPAGAGALTEEAAGPCDVPEAPRLTLTPELPIPTPTPPRLVFCNIARGHCCCLARPQASRVANKQTKVDTLTAAGLLRA